MSYIIDEYLEDLNEGLIFSNKTISVDMDKFISGKSKKLLVVGPAGSGKTTIGKILAKKYKAKFVEGDLCWEKSKKKYPEPPTDPEEYDDFENIYYTCLQKIVKSPTRAVIEGIGFLELFTNESDDTYKKLILDMPAVIVGTSTIKSTLRTYSRAKQAKAKGHNEVSPIVSFLYYGFINVFGLLDAVIKFKKERKKKGGKIEVLKLW